LELIERSVNLFAKGHSVELIEHGLVKPFTDAIGLETLGLGPSV
jgi:hypothetical protein